MGFLHSSQMPSFMLIMCSIFYLFDLLEKMCICFTSKVFFVSCRLIDFRHCWKNSRHHNTNYADTSIPSVDAKVAATLCKKGVVTCAAVLESSILMDGF